MVVVGSDWLTHSIGFVEPEAEEWRQIEWALEPDVSRESRDVT